MGYGRPVPEVRFLAVAAPHYLAQHAMPPVGVSPADRHVRSVRRKSRVLYRPSDLLARPKTECLKTTGCPGVCKNFLLSETLFIYETFYARVMQTFGRGDAK